MITLIVAALAIAIFGSTAHGRREAGAKLARWNWLFGSVTVGLWALILFA